ADEAAPPTERNQLADLMTVAGHRERPPVFDGVHDLFRPVAQVALSDLGLHKPTIPAYSTVRHGVAHPSEPHDLAPVRHERVFGGDGAEAGAAVDDEVEAADGWAGADLVGGAGADQVEAVEVDGGLAGDDQGEPGGV